MRFQRRQLLRTLSFAFGSSFIWNRNQVGAVTQNSHTAKDLASACGGRCS